MSCDVAAHQLVFDDTQLITFDTNYKVNPPLRTAADQQALRTGLADGTIDAIVSAHQPQDEENKKCEFDLAAFGLLGLPAVLPTLSKVVSDELPWALLIEKLTTQPRQLLKRSVPSIEPGAVANLTVFDPGAQWEWNAQNHHSRAINHPWYGQALTGQVQAVFHQHQHYLAQVAV